MADRVTGHKRDRKSPADLQAHMLGTYGSLRVVLTWIAVALPVAVAAAGWVQCRRLWLGPSISHYYHVPGALPLFATRDLFVGGLLAAAACLYAYKGFSTRENLALNWAGLFAFLVAVLPTAATPADRGPVSVAHGAAAVLFFLCIAYVSLRRSRDTLAFMADVGKRKEYTRWYFGTAVAMAVSPVVAVALSFALDPQSPMGRWTYFVEALGVWAFAAYWYVKTREMQGTNAERLAADAEAERVVERDADPAAAPVGEGARNAQAAPGRTTGLIERAMTPASGPVERVVPADPRRELTSPHSPVGPRARAVALALGAFLALVLFAAGRENSCRPQRVVAGARAARAP
jgi:hypothetical protein